MNQIWLDFVDDDTPSFISELVPGITVPRIGEKVGKPPAESGIPVKLFYVVDVRYFWMIDNPGTRKPPTYSQEIHVMLSERR